MRNYMLSGLVGLAGLSALGGEVNQKENTMYYTKRGGMSGL
jgi:hypothetical protein